MTERLKYFCKKLDDYVKPLLFESEVPTSIDCVYLSERFCRKYDCVCKPLKQAHKDFHYKMRHAQTSPKYKALGRFANLASDHEIKATLRAEQEERNYPAHLDSATRSDDTHKRVSPKPAQSQPSRPNKPKRLIGEFSAEVSQMPLTGSRVDRRRHVFPNSCFFPDPKYL